MTKQKPLSLEQAYTQLQEIVSQVQQGNLSLDESISKYETGMKLVKFIQTKLNKFQVQIEEIQTKF